MLLQGLMMFGCHLVAAEGRLLRVTNGLIPLSTTEPTELYSEATLDDVTLSRSALSTTVTSAPVTRGDTGGGKGSTGTVNVGVAVTGWLLAAVLTVILLVVIYRRGGFGSVARFFQRLGTAIGALRVARRNNRGRQQPATATHGNQPQGTIDIHARSSTGVYETISTIDIRASSSPGVHKTTDTIDRRARSSPGMIETTDTIDGRASSASAVYEVTEDTGRHSGPRESMVYQNMDSIRTRSSSSDVNAASDQPASSSENPAFSSEDPASSSEDPARQSHSTYAPLSCSHDEEHDYTGLAVA